VSSESTEGTERIVIEDSIEGERFMVRTVGSEKWDETGGQPVPPGEVLTPPVNESTPIVEKGIKKEDLRPLYVAKKKLWVEPEKIPDEGTSSSDSESYASNQSATSKRVDERRVEARGDWPQGGGLTSTSQRPPRRYGARST